MISEDIENNWKELLFAAVLLGLTAFCFCSKPHNKDDEELKEKLKKREKNRFYKKQMKDLPSPHLDEGSSSRALRDGNDEETAMELEEMTTDMEESRSQETSTFKR